jgi:ABC-type transporter MlaC component
LDVEIENISMLVTQQQENLAIIRQNHGRFGALIEAMKAKQTTN